jgi:hypothetical protein
MRAVRIPNDDLKEVIQVYGEMSTKKANTNNTDIAHVSTEL